MKRFPLIAFVAFAAICSSPQRVSARPVLVKTPGILSSGGCEENGYEAGTRAFGRCSADSVREQKITVVSDSVRLPGTLCLPAGVAGRVPCVVLVHGSGPSDRDETIGPNRPFRDLAHALAARGIATLRYDKRTFVYGAQTEAVSGAPMTYDTETVLDACAALRLCRTFAEVDTTRLFVLGHSLGGMLLPRIAAGSQPAPAGLVAVAAPAVKLTESLRAQLRYLAQAGGGTQAQADAAADKMLAALPGSYLDDDAAYDATKAAAATAVPMLFVQGGHDYQVTSVDFFLWKRALGHRDDVTFCFFPELDHLMRRQPAMATPASYLEQKPLSAEAVDAIADFVRAGGR